MEMRVRLACLGLLAVLVSAVLPARGLAQDQGAAALDAPAAPPAAPQAPSTVPEVFAPAPALAPVAPAPATPAPALPAFEEPEAAPAPAPASPPPAAQPLPEVLPAPVAPQPQLEPWPNTLEEGARLSCPECSCERARMDYALVRREYRVISGKVSTKRPRMLMLAGFIGAGAFTVITAMAYTQPYSEDPAEREDKVRRRRVLAEGAVAISIPLSLGLVGMHWFTERRREGAPFRERHRELRYLLRESKLTVREACRGVR